MRRSLTRLLTIALLAAAPAACQTETATTAVVTNGYASAAVYRVWWVTTAFVDPVAAGATSEAERTVPASGYAYALLAPGWDPSSSAPPAQLVALRSKTQLSVERGDVLTIAVSDATFDGNCASGRPLSQTDADEITQRIFSAQFAGKTYDATSCTASGAQPAEDGGADATGD